ncbi:MAG: acetolactate synthase [Planctomycetes bacterium]|nr:acetolactate synthase [Planctomycetota bacterium]
MPTDFDDHGSRVAEATARAHDWPCLRQFCVFLENRIGRLRDLLRHFEKHDLRIIALSINDSHECATARVMLSSYDRGREILSLSGFAYFESDIIGVVLPKGNQPFVTLCTSLLQAEVNIQYTYPLMCRPDGRCAVAISVDDIEMAIKVLTEHGHRLVNEDDLLADNS